MAEERRDALIAGLRTTFQDAGYPVAVYLDKIVDRHAVRLRLVRNSGEVAQTFLDDRRSLPVEEQILAFARETLLAWGTATESDSLQNHADRWARV